MRPERPRTRAPWSTRKKDTAPRGVFRHVSGVWAIRFTCGAGCIHKERVGPVKSDAIRAYHDRRARAHDQAGWCPIAERRQSRERARADQARERSRLLFAEYANQYLAWARGQHRSFTTTASQIKRLLATFGTRKIDEITTGDIDRFLMSLTEGQAAVTPSTVNRYRDRLSGMFKRAVRLGLLRVNPVVGIEKHKEPGGRIVYVLPDEEQAIRDALAPDLRPLFLVSINTGLRWSEQIGLCWRDVDLHAGVITVARSKHGGSRQVPINSAVRAVLFDLSLHRQHPGDPTEGVFLCRYTEASKFFPRTIERAQAALTEAGKDTSRLAQYTWHGHTFASRLVMAGVDLRSVQELGGWKTLKMVARYAHLSPAHLSAAVERLVLAPNRAAELSQSARPAAAELARN